MRGSSPQAVKHLGQTQPQRARSQLQSPSGASFTSVAPGIVRVSVECAPSHETKVLELESDGRNNNVAVNPGKEFVQQPVTITSITPLSKLKAELGTLPRLDTPSPPNLINAQEHINITELENDTDLVPAPKVTRLVGSSTYSKANFETNLKNAISHVIKSPESVSSSPNGLGQQVDGTNSLELEQLDGTVDEKESDSGLHLRDQIVEKIKAESLARSTPSDRGPFKCPKCKLLYRTSESYHKHVKGCNWEVSTDEEEDEEEEERNYPLRNRRSETVDSKSDTMKCTPDDRLRSRGMKGKPMAIVSPTTSNGSPLIRRKKEEEQQLQSRSARSLRLAENSIGSKTSSENSTFRRDSKPATYSKKLEQRRQTSTLPDKSSKSLNGDDGNIEKETKVCKVSLSPLTVDQVTLSQTVNPVEDDSDCVFVGFEQLKPDDKDKISPRKEKRRKLSLSKQNPVLEQKSQSPERGKKRETSSDLTAKTLDFEKKFPVVQLENCLPPKISPKESKNRNIFEDYIEPLNKSRSPSPQNSVEKQVHNPSSEKVEHENCPEGSLVLPAKTSPKDSSDGQPNIELPRHNDKDSEQPKQGLSSLDSVDSEDDCSIVEVIEAVNQNESPKKTESEQTPSGIHQYIGGVRVQMPQLPPDVNVGSSLVTPCVVNLGPPVSTTSHISPPLPTQPIQQQTPQASAQLSSSTLNITNEYETTDSAGRKVKVVTISKNQFDKFKQTLAEKDSEPEIQLTPSGELVYRPQPQLRSPTRQILPKPPAAVGASSPGVLLAGPAPMNILTLSPQAGGSGVIAPVLASPLTLPGNHLQV